MEPIGFFIKAVEKKALEKKLPDESTDIGDAEGPVNYANFFLNDVRKETREVLIFDPGFSQDSEVNPCSTDNMKACWC